MTAKNLDEFMAGVTRDQEAKRRRKLSNDQLHAMTAGIRVIIDRAPESSDFQVWVERLSAFRVSRRAGIMPAP